MSAQVLAGRRILVTGAAGTIGRAVCDRLAGSGALITGFDLPTDTQRHTDAVETMVHGDATDEACIAEALSGVELVVHLAAIPHPIGHPPYRVFRTNTDATFNVLSQAGERRVRRAVIASSINTLGLVYNSHPVEPAYFPLDEHSPSDLDDAYSLSKVTDELTARMVWRHWGTDIVALRFPYTATGAAIAPHAERVADDPGRSMLEGWSYLDVRDAALAVERSLISDVDGVRPLFVAADETLLPYRTEDVLDRYAPSVPRKRSFVGREVPIDLEPARTLLGFRAEHTLDLPTRELDPIEPR